jgi:mRNA-degrading endonuclease toxin of MazEF toxin-antitoxin module
VEPAETTGLDQVSYVQCELIRSINRRRLVHRLGTVGQATGREVDAVVRTLLDH